MFVETGIPGRIPYRKAFTIPAAEKDMRYWNQYGDVNWSAYKFTRLGRFGIDVSSIIIDKFYVDIDVYQLGEKCNAESAPRLEEYLEKSNTRRLWVSTHHGFNCYVKAPAGASIMHVVKMLEFFGEKKIDADSCAIDPLAQRKPVGSLMHNPQRFVTPVSGTDVMSTDIDKLVERSTKPLDPKPFWKGESPLSILDVVLKKKDAIVSAALLPTDGCEWPIDEKKICPVFSFIATKTKIGFWERLALLKYMRAVLGVPRFKLEKTACDLIGEKKWKSMSGWEHALAWASKGAAHFSPDRFKMDGYCPATCFYCVQEQERKRE
jgi:hypothetical protein